MGGEERAEVAARAGLSLEWLYLLEHELLEFEDLTGPQVAALALALQVPAVWLAACCQFGLGDLAGGGLEWWTERECSDGAEQDTEAERADRRYYQQQHGDHTLG